MIQFDINDDKNNSTLEIMVRSTYHFFPLLPDFRGIRCDLAVSNTYRLSR